MSTLTLGIIVIIYMFVIAWLGYLGYRQTKPTIADAEIKVAP